MQRSQTIEELYHVWNECHMAYERAITAYEIARNQETDTKNVLERTRNAEAEAWEKLVAARSKGVKHG